MPSKQYCTTASVYAPGVLERGTVNYSRGAGVWIPPRLIRKWLEFNCLRKNWASTIPNFFVAKCPRTATPGHRTAFYNYLCLCAQRFGGVCCTVAQEGRLAQMAKANLETTGVQFLRRSWTPIMSKSPLSICIRPQVIFTVLYMFSNTWQTLGDLFVEKCIERAESGEWLIASCMMNCFIQEMLYAVHTGEVDK